MLPYLFLFKCFFAYRIKNVKLVYDMHDLNEKRQVINIKSFIRYYLFVVLEKSLRNIQVDIITVSGGLARLFYYRNKKSAKVVCNVVPEHSGLAEENDEDHACIVKLESNFAKLSRDPTIVRLVYFGQIKADRLPVDFLSVLLNSTDRLQLDVYGTVNDDFKHIFLKFCEHNRVCFRGEYDPKDISFLKAYDYSLMLFLSNSINIRYCLPNKFFQALSYGVISIVSPNLFEVGFKYPSAVVKLSADSQSGFDIIDFENELYKRKDFDKNRLKSIAKLVHAKSRRNFYQACSVKIRKSRDS
ncbi:hypothetical protein CWE08_09305 [Aliidiomarina iranensis]|uniref:Glycosyl transferase family 1 domain-containing protein n=2 Tax=Aliidiomarina iranensis TaxID=1434071 RepID=A0A432VT67_9GAMM|nr:hypothetical protein CWE08_09305 [Aliidiomarina iranensis]